MSYWIGLHRIGLGCCAVSSMTVEVLFTVINWLPTEHSIGCHSASIACALLLGPNGPGKVWVGMGEEEVKRGSVGEGTEMAEGGESKGNGSLPSPCLLYLSQASWFPTIPLDAACTFLVQLHQREGRLGYKSSGICPPAQEHGKTCANRGTLECCSIIIALYQLKLLLNHFLNNARCFFFCSPFFESSPTTWRLLPSLARFGSN